MKKRVQTAVVASIIQGIDDRNTSFVTEILEKIFQGELQMSRAQVQLDFETSTSILVGDEGIEDLFATTKQAKKDDKPQEELSPEIKKILGDSLQGASVLSPTKGKDLGKLQLGDKIKIHITDTSERGRNIIKILKAETEEGTLKPVPARVRFIKKMQNGNWLILVDLGENIYVRIEEETDTVRIALVDVPVDTAKNQAKPGMTPIILGIGIAVFVLILTILVFML